MSISKQKARWRLGKVTRKRNGQRCFKEHVITTLDLVPVFLHQPICLTLPFLETQNRQTFVTPFFSKPEWLRLESLQNKIAPVLQANHWVYEDTTFCKVGTRKLVRGPRGSVLETKCYTVCARCYASSQSNTCNGKKGKNWNFAFKFDSIVTAS